MLIDIQPHLIFVLYLFSVIPQSLSLSRDCQGFSIPPTIVTSRAASRHKNLHVKSAEQKADRVTRVMCVGRELESQEIAT